MSEELNKILDKFDRTLEEYEFDKKCRQISIDSICHLFPSEIITIKDYIQQKENIIKEVREYKRQLLFDLNRQYITFEKWEEILDPIDYILDKENI